MQDASNIDSSHQNLLATAKHGQSHERNIALLHNELLHQHSIVAAVHSSTVVKVIACLLQGGKRRKGL